MLTNERSTDISKSNTTQCTLLLSYHKHGLQRQSHYRKKNVLLCIMQEAGEKSFRRIIQRLGNGRGRGLEKDESPEMVDSLNRGTPI